MCNNCNALFGVCDEVDGFITDLKTLSTDGVTYYPTDRCCPTCLEHRICDFVAADFARLREEGFKESDLFRWPQPFESCPTLPRAAVPITYRDYLLGKGSDPFAST